jgi:hypothetical protein
MKRFLFVALFFVAIMFISGCDTVQMSPEDSATYQKDFDKKGTGIRDRYDPEIEKLSELVYDCIPYSSNSSNYTTVCSVSYHIIATDDKGIVEFIQSLEGPTSGGASSMNVDNLKEFEHEGTFELKGPEEYTLTLTVKDAKGKKGRLVEQINTPGEVYPTFHLECINNSCVAVEGVGADECLSIGSVCGNGTNQTNTTFYCGDGVITWPEECDAALSSLPSNCQILGYYGGSLSCTDSCEFDMSGCYNIPDNMTNGTCIDYDEGQDYYTASYVEYLDSYGEYTIFEDRCFSDNIRLYEFYCDSTGYSIDRITCDNGCFEGACISNSTNSSGGGGGSGPGIVLNPGDSGRTCRDICDDTPGYSCVSAGTDSGATNGLAIVYGSSIGCIEFPIGSCNLYPGNSGQLCNGSIATWTRCRCST